jgi:signal transduction histidine kinase
MMTTVTGHLAALPSRLGLPRPTARLRLTLLYGGLFILAGAALLGFTYWLVDRATGTKVFPVQLELPVIHSGFIAPSCRLRDSGCAAAMVRSIRAAARYENWVDLHALLAQSAIALAVMAILAFGLGWIVAGRVLRPLREITNTAEAISAASLDERLALDGPDDEFKKLADTLNGLLARLEESFSAQRHFVANASHELRTPLTLNKTLLQVALRNPGTTAEQWRATGEELLESGRQQERMLEALLTLASTEAGLTRRQPVDLREVTGSVLRACHDEVQCRQLQVRTSLNPAPLSGDPDLIERLAANLLDNAVLHNTPAGTLEVTTGTEHGRAVLSVANSGPAILPADIDRLYQPFQRLATTRASNDNGHGLGLCIVRAIAKAHGAALTTCSRAEGGLHIQATFPSADAWPQPHAGESGSRLVCQQPAGQAQAEEGDQPAQDPGRYPPGDLGTDQAPGEQADGERQDDCPVHRPG